MIKPRIIVTGATGKTGSVVVRELLKGGYPVRAMVHREDARSARLHAYGAELAVADMSDVERVADALKNVQRAYQNMAEDHTFIGVGECHPYRVFEGMQPSR